MEREIRMTNNLNEVVKLAAFIEELSEELSLSKELIFKLNLALEEAVCNIIMYAFPLEEQQEIRLKATFTGHQLIFLLTDRGASFDPTDPTAIPDVDLNASLEEKPIGGLGIFLIRSIMNEVSYQRLGDENQLIMKKEI